MLISMKPMGLGRGGCARRARKRTSTVVNAASDAMIRRHDRQATEPKVKEGDFGMRAGVLTLCTPI